MTLPCCADTENRAPTHLLQPAAWPALRAAPGPAPAGRTGAPGGQEGHRQEGVAGGTHRATGSSIQQLTPACARRSSRAWVGIWQRHRQQ
jgi:hypothetical protein